MYYVIGSQEGVPNFLPSQPHIESPAVKCRVLRRQTTECGQKLQYSVAKFTTTSIFGPSFCLGSYLLSIDCRNRTLQLQCCYTFWALIEYALIGKQLLAKMEKNSLQIRMLLHKIFEWVYAKKNITREQSFQVNSEWPSVWPEKIAKCL